MSDRSDLYDRLNGRENSQQARPTARQRPAQPNEFENYVSEVADKPLRRFGANLLLPDSRDFIVPATTTVPPDYRLNPGDELIIGLTGAVRANELRLIIDPNGRIFMPNVGAVNVAGVRYGDVQSVIARQIGRQYRDFRLSVTVGRLHGITVYVTGFAAVPGSYTMSSLSTLVNAVLAAGGPSAGGSFRSIQLRRGGKLVSEFDAYDLLLKGDKSGDAALQNDDVIYIAPVGPQTAVIGSVNSEAVFEARPGQTVNDLLLYAGGVNSVGDDARALLLDPVKGPENGWRELTPAEAKTMPVVRGQVIRVLSKLGIARPLNQQPVLVTVTGEVNRPGRYYMASGVSMEAVIAQAGGLTSDAYVFGTVVTRESVRLQQRQSYERAIRDVSISLTASPLVQARADQLGGDRQNAVKSLVEQLRAVKPDGRVLLDVTPAAGALPSDVRMENNDAVYVPPRPTTVGVFGAVPSPGSFQYVPGMTLRQILRRAGGPQKLGEKSAVFVVRANGITLDKRRLGEKSLPGDLMYVPYDVDRGLFWDRLRDFTNLFFQSAVTGAAVVAATR